MKKTTILKIWGLVQLVIGILLIILATTVFRIQNQFSSMDSPNIALLIPGAVLAVFSLPIIFMGFSPQIAKFVSKIQSETIDHADDEMIEVSTKSAAVITPAIGNVTKTISDNLTSKEPNKKELLLEAKQLLDDKLITEIEYQDLRKKILNS